MTNANATFDLPAARAERVSTPQPTVGLSDDEDRLPQSGSTTDPQAEPSNAANTTIGLVQDEVLFY